MSEMPQGHAVPGLTDVQEHIETIRDWMEEQEEPSDFAFDALRRIERLAAAKDQEIERLKADNEALAGAGRALLACIVESMPHAEHERRRFAAMDVLDKPRPTFLLEELTRLRAQVATLITGQQRASEARRQAFRELAEEVLALPSHEQAAHLARIIDRSEDKP